MVKVALASGMFFAYIAKKSGIILPNVGQSRGEMRRNSVRMQALLIESHPVWKPN